MRSDAGTRVNLQSGRRERGTPAHPEALPLPRHPCLHMAELHAHIFPGGTAKLMGINGALANPSCRYPARLSLEKNPRGFLFQCESGNIVKQLCFKAQFGFQNSNQTHLFESCCEVCILPSNPHQKSGVCGCLVSCEARGSDSKRPWFGKRLWYQTVGIPAQPGPSCLTSWASVAPSVKWDNCSISLIRVL